MLFGGVCAISDNTLKLYTMYGISRMHVAWWNRAINRTNKVPTNKVPFCVYGIGILLHPWHVEGSQPVAMLFPE